MLNSILPRGICLHHQRGYLIWSTKKERKLQQPLWKGMGVQLILLWRMISLCHRSWCLRLSGVSSKKLKEVAPTDCGAALDHCEKLELVKVVDERGKGLSTTMGTKTSYHEGGLVFGLLSRWVQCVAAAAAYEVDSAAVLLKIKTSRNVWIAAIKGHQFPVACIG